MSSLPPKGALASLGRPGAGSETPTLGAGVSSLPPEGALAARGGPSPLDDRSRASGAVHTTVAVVAYPRISNLDEFQPLKNVPGVRLVWARSPAELAGADWIVLPGSKATAADLAWLRTQGLDRAIAAHAGQGGTVLGVYLHGLLEAPAVLQDLFGSAGGASVPTLDAVFDGLARTVDACFDAHFLRDLLL